MGARKTNLIGGSGFFRPTPPRGAGGGARQCNRQCRAARGPGLPPPEGGGLGRVRAYGYGGFKRFSPGGTVPEGKSALVFKEMTITDEAGLVDFRGSLRSSSKWAPNNPSSSGVYNVKGFLTVWGLVPARGAPIPSPDCPPERLRPCLSGGAPNLGLSEQPGQAGSRRTARVTPKLHPRAQPATCTGWLLSWTNPLKPRLPRGPGFRRVIPR